MLDSEAQRVMGTTWPGDHSAWVTWGGLKGLKAKKCRMCLLIESLDPRRAEIERSVHQPTWGAPCRRIHIHYNLKLSNPDGDEGESVIALSHL